MLTQDQTLQAKQASLPKRNSNLGTLCRLKILSFAQLPLFFALHCQRFWIKSLDLACSTQMTLKLVEPETWALIGKLSGPTMMTKLQEIRLICRAKMLSQMTHQYISHAPVRSTTARVSIVKSSSLQQLRSVSTWKSNASRPSWMHSGSQAQIHHLEVISNQA